MRLKRITAVLLAALMLCTLTGCNEVKEMKRTQAFWGGEEFGDTIEWGGYVYRKSADSGMYKDIFPYGYSGYKQSGYVTAKDVPALLQGMYGSSYNLSPDQYVMSVFYNTVYIREDVYDTFLGAKEQDLKTVWYVSVTDFGSGMFDVRTENHLLSDEDGKRLEQIASDPQNAMAEDEFYSRYENASGELMYLNSAVILRGKTHPAVKDFFFESEDIGTAMMYERDGKTVIVIEDPTDGYCHLLTEEETAYFGTKLFPEP